MNDQHVIDAIKKYHRKQMQSYVVDAIATANVDSTWQAGDIEIELSAIEDNRIELYGFSLEVGEIVMALEYKDLLSMARNCKKKDQPLALWDNDDKSAFITILPYDLDDLVEIIKELAKKF